MTTVDGDATLKAALATWREAWANLDGFRSATVATHIAAGDALAAAWDAHVTDQQARQAAADSEAERLQVELAEAHAEIERINTRALAAIKAEGRAVRELEAEMKEILDALALTLDEDDDTVEMAVVEIRGLKIAYGEMRALQHERKQLRADLAAAQRERDEARDDNDGEVAIARAHAQTLADDLTALRAEVQRAYDVASSYKTWPLAGRIAAALRAALSGPDGTEAVNGGG